MTDNIYSRPQKSSFFSYLHKFKPDVKSVPSEQQREFGAYYPDSNEFPSLCSTEAGFTKAVRHIRNYIH